MTSLSTIFISLDPTLILVICITDCKTRSYTLLSSYNGYQKYKDHSIMPEQFHHFIRLGPTQLFHNIHRHLSAALILLV